jgi:chaperonin cofactor prefoldin
VKDEKPTKKVSPAIQERRNKTARDVKIAGFMAGNPLVRDLMTEKLRSELTELREALENAVDKPLDQLRFLQGRIKGLKDMLAFVSGTM